MQLRHEPVDRAQSCRVSQGVLFFLPQHGLVGQQESHFVSFMVMYPLAVLTPDWSDGSYPSPLLSTPVLVQMVCW